MSTNRQIFKIAAGIVFLFSISCGSGSDDEGGSPTDAPAAPTKLAVRTVDGGAHLTWVDNADDEDSYMVERMEHPSGSWEVLATVPADSTEHHDVDRLKAGGMYMYRVMAMGESGTESGYTAEVTWSAP